MPSITPEFCPCLAHRRRTAADLFECGGALVILLAVLSTPCLAGSSRKAHASAPDLTVSRPSLPPPIPPLVPPPVSVIPGYPLTPFDVSIVDGDTRFLTPGPAQARCPGQTVVFIAGVVNPLRSTAPGDGAYMCRSDAVVQGYLSPYP